MLQLPSESMERAGHLLAKIKLTDHGITDEQLARSAWAVAVGERIASRTGAVRLVRSRLVIEVEDATWQRNLFGLRGFILQNLEKALGRPVVTELEFRIGVPRRRPERAASASGNAADEADAIKDPIFRSIYRASRKKANA